MANKGYLLTSHVTSRPGLPLTLRLMPAPVASGSTRSRPTTVTAVTARRSRSRQARRRRRQVLLWMLAAVVVTTTTFGAGLLAAPVDYSFQPQPPQAVLLLDSHNRVFATIRSPQAEEDRKSVV